MVNHNYTGTFEVGGRIDVMCVVSLLVVNVKVLQGKNNSCWKAEMASSMVCRAS